MVIPTTSLKLTRVGPGGYTFSHYAVTRNDAGWRWYDRDNLSTGGEWRSTLREAALDLDAYINERTAQ